VVVSSLRRTIGWVWKQPTFYPVWKLEIIKGNTTYDVTADAMSGEVNDGATETIGSFNIKLANYTGTYTNVFTGNEEVKFYADYAATATTLRFLGRIDKAAYSNYTLIITGRSESVAYLGATVTKQYTNQEASTILTDLISAYSTGFTTTNVVASTTNMTVNWYQKPFWDCVKEICNASGSDAYIDSSKDWHFFREKTITSTTEAIVHGANLLNTGEFAEDKAQIRNRIIVYGQESIAGPLIYTAEDADSYIDLKRWQEEPINDTNITTYAQAQERGDYELSVRLIPPIVGDLTSIGLPTLNPGDKLRISDPDNGITPNAYRVISFKHNFGNDDIMKTTVTIEKSSPTVSSVLKDRISGEQKLADLSNPYEKRFSYNFGFDDETLTESHSNTQIVDSRLLLVSGTTGTWTSTARTATSDVTSVHIKASGEAIPGTVFYISVDNGITWETVSLDANYTLLSTGRNPKLKIDINSAGTQLDWVSVLYR